MSRLKLFLLMLAIAVLTILFIQNQDPIALQLLCPSSTQSCLYRSPELPFSIWIGLFTLGGIITSLFGGAINRYTYSSSGKQKQKSRSDDLYPESKNWVDKDGDFDSNSSSKREDSVLSDSLYKSSSYEIPQKPQNVERSGSNYSYKYKEAKEKPQKDVNGSKRASVEPQENDDEDWI